MARKTKSSEKQNTEQKSSDVDALLTSIFKKRNYDISFRGGMEVVSYSKGAISTGLFTLDRALGVWGIPWERVIEIYGPPLGGKSTLAFKILSEAQKADPDTLIFFIDLERTLDLTYARANGVNVDSPNFVVDKPATAEEAMDAAVEVIQSGVKSIIVVDSVAALVPQEELNKNFTDEERVGSAGKLTSRTVKKIVSLLEGSNSSIIYINQVRQKIGNISGGPKTTTTGGLAIPFYASMRLSVVKIQQIEFPKGSGSIIGHKAKIRVEKNKLAPPFKEIVTDLYYGSGFCSTTNIVDLAIESGIIVQGGAWYTLLGKKFNGYYNLIEGLLDNNAELYLLVRDAIIKLYDAHLPYENAYTDKEIIFGHPDDIRKVEDPDIFVGGIVNKEANELIAPVSENIETKGELSET